MYLICMSPTVFKTLNIRIVVNTNDHGNPHVHVVAPDCEAKIYLNTFEIERSFGFTKRDLRRIIRFIEDFNLEFLERWYEIHKE